MGRAARSRCAEKIALDTRAGRRTRAGRSASGCGSTRCPATRSDEAWAHAQWLLDGLDPETIADAQAALGASESTGQQRMLALRGRCRRRTPTRASSRSSPNLWTGVGLVRGGAGTALVGSHEEVADRIEEYHALGIDEVILSGYPHVEEAYRFAEGVTPVLRERGLLSPEDADDRVAVG